MSAAQADKPQSGVRENGMLGVNETRAGLGLALFAVASLIGLFGVTWLEVRHNTTDGVLETTVAIIHTMQSVVVVAAAWVYLTVEGSAMIAEKYLKKRYQDGRARTRPSGASGTRPTGAVERCVASALHARLGRGQAMIAEKYEAQGRLEAQGTAWYERWQEAKRRGEDFDEPPPEMKD